MMKGKQFLGVVLSLTLLLQYGAAVNADEENIIIQGNLLYSEDFESETQFSNNPDYSVTTDGEKGVLQLDAAGKMSNMQSLAGEDAADVIADFDVRLISASGATNNSLFFTLRASEAGGAGIKFAHHDITKYNSETGSFGTARTRDRISIAYSGGSDDMTSWDIAAMSDTLGIENTSTRSFSDYYTFKTAVAGGLAYFKVTDSDGNEVKSLNADISGYSAPEHGKMYVGAHNCTAYIDNIKISEAIRAKQISIEAENMELTAGETTSFNVRVLDTDDKWHSLDKSLNSSFSFDYDSEKLSIDADAGTITANASDGLSVRITGHDAFSGAAKTDEFVFESVSDEAAVTAAKAALELGVDYAQSDFELPGEGLYKTSVAWESSDSAIRINGTKARVFKQTEERIVTLTAVISRGGAQATRDFSVTVPAVKEAERDVILKGELIYSEDFDDGATMDTAFLSALNGQTIKHEDGALHIDSKGAVLMGPQFGPDTDGCIVEYDAMELGCNANSNAQFSVGLMDNGAGSYRFAYADVSLYNPLTNELNGTQNRDHLFIGRTSGSANMSNWSLFGMGKSPLGILNKTTRSFGGYHTFSAAAAGNTMLFSVENNGAAADTVSIYDPQREPGHGALSLNMQSTELMLDNIKVYRAVAVKGIELKTKDAVLKPNVPMEFEIVLSNGAALDSEFYGLLDFSCDEGMEIDKEQSLITVNAEGDFAVVISAEDFLDSSVTVTKSAVVTASNSAEEIKELADAFKIDDYIEYPNRIINDFTLPDNFRGARIKWTSDNEAIKIDGAGAAVTRGGENTPVTLTAKITLNGVSVEKKFTVTVEKDYSASQTIEMDKEEISIPERTTQNISLPTLGRYGSRITWKSDNAGLISDTGIVRRNVSDTPVRLTAVFEVGTEKETHYYNVIVVGTGNGGGGGASGGGGGGSARTVSVPVSAAQNSDDAFEFADVPGDFWAAQSIYDLVKRGVISKDTMYRPNNSVTREEFVKLVVEAFGLYDSAAQADFADVAEDAWYYRYVASALSCGAVQGLDDSVFGSGANITRQDIAVIIYRVLLKRGQSLGSGAAGFDDYSDIAGYAADAVASLAGAGVITGMDNNVFAPRENATRAQAAAMIKRACDLAE